ncbi:hypothetical protein L218DRAFT_1003980 [Marasmius fiardii PR-910]|nr:hypothetical protein L218DRAFT_1003980 [Marasmius fiardii PR-910]
MTNNICPIPGDADIAGIGVRAAVYVQACLAACSTACLDIILLNYTQAGEEFQRNRTPHIASPEHDHSSYIRLAKSLERSIFTVGFLIIITAVIQLFNTNGLTPYHTLIILNISLINNWAGVLLLSRRGGLTWFRTRTDILNTLPCVAHTTLLCGFALHFWFKQGAFLSYTEESAPCQPLTYYWVFGPVDSTSQPLKKWSLMFYMVTMVPFVGFYLHYFLFGIIGLMIVYAILMVIILPTLIICAKLPEISLKLLMGFALRIPKVNHSVPPDHHLRQSWSSLGSSIIDNLIATMKLHSIHNLVSIWTALATPIIYLIISTESIVKLNVPYVSVSENKWSYGQTLAISTMSVFVLLSGWEWWKIMKEARRSWLVRKSQTEACELQNLVTPQNTVQNL